MVWDGEDRGRGAGRTFPAGPPGRRRRLGARAVTGGPAPGGSAWTPAAPSPTWSTATGRVVKVLVDPGRPVGRPSVPAIGRRRGGRRAGPRHHRGHQRPARAPGRAGWPWSATEGHADVIEIARQVGPSLYDQWADRPETARAAHLARRGRRAARRHRAANWSPRRPGRARRRGRRGGGLPPARRPQPGPRAGRWPPPSAGGGVDVTCSTRCPPSSGSTSGP